MTNKTKEMKIIELLSRIADVLEFEEEQKWSYISDNKRRKFQELKEKSKQ